MAIVKKMNQILGKFKRLLSPASEKLSLNEALLPITMCFKMNGPHESVTKDQQIQEFHETKRNKILQNHMSNIDYAKSSHQQTTDDHNLSATKCLINDNWFKNLLAKSINLKVVTIAFIIIFL